VGHIYLVFGSPKAPAKFIVVPVVKSNLKSLIKTWKNIETIYRAPLLCIPGNTLALFIEFAF